MGIHLRRARTLDCALWYGAGIRSSQDTPSGFYLPHLNVGQRMIVLLPLLPLDATLCLLASQPCLPGLLDFAPLPIWMIVASLSPWLSYFHTVPFSDSSGCHLFWDVVTVVLWLYEEAKYVNLRLHLDQKSNLSFLRSLVNNLSYICRVIFAIWQNHGLFHHDEAMANIL